MTKKMIVNAVDPDEVRIAILNDRTLEDFDIETDNIERNKGNIYKGTVMAVEPALGAAFVHYGPDKQGFLTANDVHPKYAPTSASSDDKDEKNGRIDKLLRVGQELLVQVSKDEVGQKGAVLTTFLSLAGRYLVLMPDSDIQGVSRKIDDDETRRRIREATAKLDVPEKMGVIIRTAGRDRTKLDLNRDLRVLLRLWENIQREAQTKKAPALIYQEQDVIIRALRDYFAADIDEIVLDSDEAYDRASEYMRLVMPNHRSVLTRYIERRPIFHHFGIESQLAAIYTPRVALPSGGSIVIEMTEALVAIDVNSGKQKSTNQEETAFQTNIEAAAAIPSQLRIRQLGGIIVVDFIDMLLSKNKIRVERELKKGFMADKARIFVGRISPRNGTLTITRQRTQTALRTTMFVKCEACAGSGHKLNPRSQALAVIRALRDRTALGDVATATVHLAPEVAKLFDEGSFQTALQQLKESMQVEVKWIAEPRLTASKPELTFTTHANVQPLLLPEPNFGPAPRPEDYSEDFMEEPEPTSSDLNEAGFALPSYELFVPEKSQHPSQGTRKKAWANAAIASETPPAAGRKPRSRVRSKPKTSEPHATAMSSTGGNETSREPSERFAGRSKPRRHQQRQTARIRPSDAAAIANQPSTTTKAAGFLGRIWKLFTNTQKP